MNVTDQRPTGKKSCLPDGMERPKKALPVDPTIKKLIADFVQKHGIPLKAEQAS